jgi:hypothetical protein
VVSWRTKLHTVRDAGRHGRHAVGDQGRFLSQVVVDSLGPLGTRCGGREREHNGYIGTAGLAGGPVKWFDRWAERAQRKSDLRAERYLRHVEGVRAGTEPPRILERMENQTQERIRRGVPWRLEDAWLTWIGDGHISGPDGVEVIVSVQFTGRDLTFPYAPAELAPRLRAQPPPSLNNYAVCVRRMPDGPVESTCMLPNETHARWQAIELAKQVAQYGITALRPSKLDPPGHLQYPGVDELISHAIDGVSASLARGSRWLPEHARAGWRRVRTGRPM